MNTEARTNGRKRRVLFAALAALVLAALALGTATVVWALDRPRGIQASPSSIHFGDQVVGRQSVTQALKVTNHGGQPTIDSIRIEGEDADDFCIADASTCATGPFEKGASCTISVRFTPTRPGDRAAALFVSGFSGGPGVSLWGTGRTS